MNGQHIRVTGQAGTYQPGVNAVGAQFYTTMQVMQLMQVMGDRHVRMIPDIMVGGNQHNVGALVAMMGILLWNQARGMQKDGNHQPAVVQNPSAE